MTSTRRPGRPPGPAIDRRQQVVLATIDLVAEGGYGAATLGKVAEHVGLSKASVLHHAGSVENLVRSAQGYVVSSMLEHVTAAVRAAAPQEGPRVYIETMVRHFRENPHHTRMLTEALTHGHDLGDAGTNEAAGGTSVATGRWQGVATLLAHAREAGCLPERSDLRTPALLIGGGIDAIVGEALRDPDFDDDAAATELADVAEAAWLR